MSLGYLRLILTMPRSLSMNRIFVLAVLVVASTLVVPANDAAALDCFDFVMQYAYTYENCSAQPDIDRVFRLQVILWKGHEYLFVDEGNELKIMNIDDPLNPTSVVTSAFNMPNLGDSDYDLINFSVCDDCRYGVAAFKAGKVIFDLGTGVTPQFAAMAKYFEATFVPGAFTYKHSTGQQYLVASNLGDACSSSGSGLYFLNSTNMDLNPRLQCLDKGTTVPPALVNGIALGGSEPTAIYMSESADNFHIFQVRTSPTYGLDHIGNAGIARANMYRGYGIDVDEAVGLMAVAHFGDLSIYDIGYGSGSPASPVLLKTMDLAASPNANAVALKFPVLHVAQQYTRNVPALTFDVSSPTNPVPLDQGFWDPANSWNALGDCVWNNHTVFSDDGSAMYLSRYSALQVIDPNACSGPVANLSLSPQLAFPGDFLTVTNTSLGGQRFATWITDGPNAHSATILAGSISFTTGTNLGYTLPANMATGDVFYAHAAVETDIYPYVAGSTPGQLRTQQITIDRTPEASITITPPAAVTGDGVDLTAVAEGHPAVPGGGDPFAWTVTDPSGSPTDYVGVLVEDVVLTMSGQWSFDLDVQYQHGDGYQATAPTVIRNISSVSAFFGITPSNPVHNQAITLTSNSAASAGATLDFDWDVLNTNGSLAHELVFCDGAGPVNDQCVLPAETLDYGIYDFRLTLTNTAMAPPSDVSVARIDDFEIRHLDFPVGFTWSPTNPEIGQWVTFRIDGVDSADIEVAEWDFGAGGCDGASQYYTCTPGSIPCDLAPFQYASGGTKTVKLTVTTTGGIQQPQVTHNIAVASTGSCQGTPTCTYSVSPTNRVFGNAGGPGTFTVSTQSGCSWSASEFASWVSITSGASGNGSGTVNYQVDVNSGAARVATINVAGKTHTITQEGVSTCPVSISPTSNAFTWQGGDAVVTVSAAPDCAWIAEAPDPWIALTSPVFGTGSGSVSYEVAKNEGDQRSGFVGIGDQIHMVSQGPVGPCGRGSVADDGSVENGYGWGVGSIFVQEFTPDVYPYVYTDVCTAFTQAGGDTTLSFDVLVFDDDGPGGGPGTLIGTVPAIVGEVPPWLDHTFASVAIQDAGIAVYEGSVFIGVGWDEVSEIGFFVAADESTTTPVQNGYFSDDWISWSAISGVFPGYHSLMVRADGFAPIDGEWEQKVGSIFGGGNGFGDPSNTYASTMATFDGTLFVGTENHFGGEINFTADGQNWFLGNNPGFGDSTNDAIALLISFGDYLYASTFNPVYGAQVWRTAVPLAWANVEEDGFGDPSNVSAPSGAVFDDVLFVGTSHSGGCEVWRTPDGDTWTQVHTNGFGTSQNQVAESMAVFQGELRVGTRNVNGAELWRSPDGFVWYPVMTGGFGSSSNKAITDLVVFQNTLYAGVTNGATGAQVWRSVNGSSWVQTVADGFGNPDNTEFHAFAVNDLGLIAAVSGPASPGTVWLSADGVTWTVDSSPGFSNPDNGVIGTLQYWDDRIYAGTANVTAGCEVWRDGRHPVFEDGFESGDTDAWGEVVP